MDGADIIGPGHRRQRFLKIIVFYMFQDSHFDYHLSHTPNFEGKWLPKDQNEAIAPPAKIPSDSVPITLGRRRVAPLAGMDANCMYNPVTPPV
jgi:hypothetical protein